MSIQQIIPSDAFQLLQADANTVYLDVRTVSEFMAGHPKGALNIPVMLPDTATGQMTPNPKFAAAVEGSLPKDAKVVVGCLSGKRSQFAAEQMEKAGYRNLWNMQGGFGGARDPMGGAVVKGWRDSGLPVEAGEGGPAGYQALLKNVK